MSFANGDNLKDGDVYSADGWKLHHKLECRVAWNRTNELSLESFVGTSSETIEGRVVVLLSGIRKDLTKEAFEEIRDRRLRTRHAGEEFEFIVRDISGHVICRLVES